MTPLRQFALMSLIMLTQISHQSTAEPIAVPAPATSNVGQNPFRVSIEMFEGDQETAFAKRLVLFQEGMVYDIDMADRTGNVTVYDLKTGRVLLLDRKAKERASVRTDDLVKMAAGLKASLVASQKQEAVGIGAHVQDNGGSYVVEFGEVQYRTVAQTPKNELAASDFAQYADWALRLNIPRRMGLPPFGRMALNHQLAQDGKLPAEMTLEIKRKEQVSRFRSTHELAESITESDENLIVEIASMMVLFREVPLKAIR